MQEEQKQPEPKLVWFEQIKYGYFPCNLVAKPEEVYNKDYFDRYQSYEGTEVEKCLNAARVALVNKHVHSDQVGVDVGIGAGTFLSQMPTWYGFDVNPVGVEWLKSQTRWHDIYCAKDNWRRNIQAFTFWDVFEHLSTDEMEDVMRFTPNVLIISIPLFESEAEVLASKHFRPTEHYHYFSDVSLRSFMIAYGYECVETNTMEQECGREAIYTYVFKRIVK